VLVQAVLWKKGSGSFSGVTGSGQIGLGEGVEANAYLGFNGDSSGGLTLNDPAYSHQAYGLEEENGRLQPLQLEVNGGASAFLGVGGIGYGGGH
jgi:hypothetical protein